MEEYLSISQAAKELGVSSQTLRRWDGAGKLKPTKLPGSNHRKYSRKLIDRIKNSKSSISSAEAKSKPKMIITEMQFDPHTFLGEPPQFRGLLHSLAVNAKGYQDVESVDGTNDLGVDIRAYEVGVHNKKDKLVYIQSKFKRNITLSTLKDEIDKLVASVLAGELEPPDKYIIGCSGNIGAKARRSARHYIKPHLPDVRLVFWGVREIDDMIKADKATYERYILRPMKLQASVLPPSGYEKEIEASQPANGALLTGSVSDIDDISNAVDIKIKRSSNLIEQGQISKSLEILSSLNGVAQFNKLSNTQRARIENNLGVVSMATRDYDGATSHFEKALDEDPDMDKAKVNLAHAYLLTKRVEDASRIIGGLTNAVDAEDPRYISMALGIILSKEGGEKAKEEYEKLELKHHRHLNEENVRRQAAYIYLSLGNFSKMFLLLDKNIEEDPTDVYSIYLKAVGKVAEASEQAEINNLSVIPNFNRPELLVEAISLFKEAYSLILSDETSRHLSTEIMYNLMFCRNMLNRYHGVAVELPNYEFSGTEPDMLAVEMQEKIESKDFKSAYEIYEKMHDLPLKILDHERIAKIFLYSGSPEYALRVLEKIEDTYVSAEVGSLHWLQKSISEVLLDNKTGAIAAAKKAVKTSEIEDVKNTKQAMSHQGALFLRYPKDGESLLESMLAYDNKFPEDHSLKKINLEESKQELIDAMLERRKGYEQVRDAYIKGGVPNHTLATLLNKSFIELLNQRDVDLPLKYIDPGTEFVDSISEILDEAGAVIFDYQSLYTLSKTKLLGYITRLSKKVYIHFETFSDIQQDLLKVEDPELRRLWEFLRSSSDIHFVFKVGIIDQELAKMSDVDIPVGLNESIQFALDGKATLVTDDLQLMKTVNIKRKSSATNSYAFINKFMQMELIDDKRMSQVKYELADLCYAFLPFNADDLSEAVWLSDYKMSRAVAFYINEIHLHGSDPTSFAGVFVGFMYKLWTSGALPEDKVYWFGIINEQLSACINGLHLRIKDENLDVDITELMSRYLYMWVIPRNNGGIDELKLLISKSDELLSAEFFQKTRSEIIKGLNESLKIRES